jgi:hypothetical protein
MSKKKRRQLPGFFLWDTSQVDAAVGDILKISESKEKGRRLPSLTIFAAVRGATL